MKKNLEISFHRPRFRIFALLALMTELGLWVSSANAQRGVDVTSHVSDTGPSAGVPGFFDTNVAKKDSLVADFPTFSIDYGITSQFTLGTSLPTLIYTPLTISNRERTFSFFNLKLRYQLFSTQEWKSAITGYFMRAKISVKNPLIKKQLEEQISSIGAASLNFSRDTTYGRVGMSMLFARIENEGKQLAIGVNSSTRTLQLTSAWWRFPFLETLETETLLSFCPIAKRRDISNNLRLDVTESCYGDGALSPLMRGLLNWRTSESWLFSLGGLWIPSVLSNPIPILSLHYMTPLFSNKIEDNFSEKENEVD